MDIKIGTKVKGKIAGVWVDKDCSINKEISGVFIEYVPMDNCNHNYHIVDEYGYDFWLIDESIKII